MAEGAAPKKRAARKTKPAAAPDGVLGALPATRPARVGRRARPGDSATTPKPAAARARAKAAPRPKSKAKAKPRAQAVPIPPAGPRAVRAGSHKLVEPIEQARTKRPETPAAPSGTELVTTVVQAAGELAQVGLTVTGQLLKRAVDKLPRP